MNINSLIHILNERKVYLEQQSGNLKISAPKGVLDKELVALIKDKKPELISFFSKVQLSTIQKAPKKKYYRLTPSQYRLWVTSELGGTHAYNIPVFCEIDGNIDHDIARQAVGEVAKRHDAIRTCFRFNEDNEICQYIVDFEDFKLDLDYADISADPGDRVSEILDEVVQHAFDLENGPLLKVGLIKVSAHKHILYILMHHLVSDGWSMEIFFNNLIHYYEVLSSGVDLFPLEPLQVQYSDYSEWLNSNLEKINEKESDFWVDMFKEDSPVMKLPFERNRPLKKTYSGASILYETSEHYFSKIEAFCKKQGCTPFSLSMAALKVLLSKYSGLTDVTIGFPISGRVNEKLENQIGLYINTIPLRSKFSFDMTFREMLEHEYNLLKATQGNQLFSMDHLLSKLDLKPTPGHTPLFDILIAYQNQTSLGMYDLKDFSKGEVKSHAKDIPFSQFDISISTTEFDGIQSHYIQYNTDIYDHAHIETMLGDYVYIMEHLIDNCDLPLKTLFQNAKYIFLTDKKITFSAVEDNSNFPARRKVVLNNNEGLSVKMELQTLLSEYLKDVTFDDDYFERGGSSLGAIQFVNDVNKKYNAKLTILDFYNNASVNKLYKLISVKPKENKDIDIVMDFGLPESDLPKLFMLPPIIGTCLLFRPLANAMGKSFKSYGLDMPILDGAKDTFRKVVRILSRRIMKMVDKNDVVYLMGYSVGVNFAFEITKILESRNYKVILFLVDKDPESNKQYEVTEDLVKDITKAHEPMLKTLDTMGEDVGNAKARIRQTLYGLKSYEVQGKIKAPVIAFEAKENIMMKDYMTKWSEYTEGKYSLYYLDGNHYDAFGRGNLNKLKNTLNKTVNELSGIY